MEDTPAPPIQFLYSSIDVDIQTEKKTSAPSNLSQLNTLFVPVDLMHVYPCDDISALTTLQAWLARTIQKLDTHLLGVCQIFNEESYLIVSVLKIVFHGFLN